MQRLLTFPFNNIDVTPPMSDHDNEKYAQSRSAEIKNARQIKFLSRLTRIRGNARYASLFVASVSRRISSKIDLLFTRSGKSEAEMVFALVVQRSFA